jgi:hypothetical protein
MQESIRKDVERTFDVLQKHFDIICGPAEYWKPKMLWKIVKCHVIFHNMIIEDERDMAGNLRYISNGEPVELEHDANMIQRFLVAH